MTGPRPTGRPWTSAEESQLRGRDDGRVNRSEADTHAPGRPDCGITKSVARPPPDRGRSLFGELSRLPCRTSLIGNPDAGSKSISLPRGSAARHGLDRFCGDAIWSYCTQSWTCTRLWQRASGVWGWRCAGRRICSSVTFGRRRVCLRRRSGGWGLRRQRGFGNGRRTGKRRRMPDRFTGRFWGLLLS
jgi:hypothetical protein